MTDSHRIDSDTINRLADKLASLTLDAGEKAALDMILDRAADADGEVVGYRFETDAVVAMEEKKKLMPPDLSVGGLKIAAALGFNG